jgi:phosphatidylglycerol:prolipoprotein diacylglycerol transferase
MAPAALAAYLHRIDPFALELWDGVGIRWYGLSYIGGFLAAYLLIRGLTRRGLTQLDTPRVADFIFAVALGTVVGGRLGYCVFYSPALLVDFSADPPFWGVLALNRGGMASHGGLIGIVVACILYARRLGISALHLLDLSALAAGIGICFGRIANFINGELVGRPAPPDLPWAVKFPTVIRDWPAVAPDKLAGLTPLVEQLGPEHLPVTPGLWRVEVAANPLSATVYQTLDRIIELTRTAGPAGDTAAAMLRPLLTPRHPSQLYEALLEGVVVFAVLFWIWRKPRKPGVVGGAFLLIYAVVRIIGEQFRRPDLEIAHLEFAALGVTRGQLLSLAMLLAGVAYLWIAARRPADPLGGWRRKPGTQPQTPHAAANP